MNSALRYFLVFTLPLSASAQQATEEETSNSRQLEEVIVSATKRDKSVRDIPISIDAFSGEDLMQIGAVSIQDIVKYSPGVIVSGDNITIRGLANAGGLYTRTVGRFYDGVSLINPSIVGVQPQFDPYDVASVEILKGPQGTLFGGSALTGALRYVPTAPNLEEGLAASLSYTESKIKASDDRGRDVRGMINIPLWERVGLRYVRVESDTAGWVDDTHFNLKDYNSGDAQLDRALLLFRVTENLDIQFSWLDQTSSYDGNIFSNTEVEDDNPQRSTRRQEETGEFATKIKGFKISWAWGDILDIVLDVNELEKASRLEQGLETYLGAEDTDARLPAINNFTTEQPSYELRFVSNQLSGGWWPVRDWEYTFGFFVMESDQEYTGPLQATIELFSSFPGAGDSLFLNSTQGGTNTKVTALAEEEAFFFDVTRTFFEKLEVNLGGRYF